MEDNAKRIALDAITILHSLGYGQYAVPLLNRLERLDE